MFNYKVKMRVSYMNVLTYPYEVVHNKTPRGHGLWMFKIINRKQTGGVDNATTFSHTGFYSEAKKAAVKEARRLKADTVHVQP